MAIYRLSAKSISRGKAQSAVASAAYRAAEKLHDKTIDKHFNYSRKQEVSYTEIMLPNGSDQKFKDRETLWNEVEKSEKRKDAELAKEYQISIPKELNKEQSIELIKEFTQRVFVDKGLAADVCFHKLESENPHAHIMTTTRTLDANGLSIKKDRSIKPKNYIVELRKEWEITANQYMQSKGIDESISASSYKSLGIDIEGIHTSLGGADGKIHTELQREINSLKLLNDPSQIAIALTDKKAIFNDRDVNNFLNRHVMDEHRDEVMSGLIKDDQLVVIDKEKGLYTSVDYLASERSLVADVKEASKRHTFPVKQKVMDDVSREMGLSKQQETALAFCTKNDSNVKNIEGFAGSGKSYTINAIREVYERSGYSTVGLALSGIISDNLSKDANIEQSSTIASFLNRYDKGNINIDSKTVVFTDESSLIGVKDYSRIKSIVKEANAKIINVGDDNQLQAIQAGGASQLIKANSNSVTLDEIRRQKSDEDKEATLFLSTGKQREALTHYKDKGAIVSHSDQKELGEAIVKKEIENRLNGVSSLVMAHKKITVKALNSAIHNSFKEQGLIEKEGVKLQGKEYCNGDRFIFLKNDYQLNVRNGMTGTVSEINKDGNMSITLDDDRVVAFNGKEYKDHDHGYAVTLHKSEGVSVDRTQVYLDKDTDRHLSLVGLSRHKEDVTLHTLDYSDANKSGIKGFEHLVRACSRDRTKDTVQFYNETLHAHFESKKTPIENEKHSELQRSADIADRRMTTAVDLHNQTVKTSAVWFDVKDGKKDIAKLSEVCTKIEKEISGMDNIKNQNEIAATKVKSRTFSREKSRDCGFGF